MLTTAQLATLKADILASTDQAVIDARTIRNDTELARLYNLPSSFIAWRSSVQTKEVGVAVNYVAVEAMTDANRVRITTFYTMNPDSFSPARSDIRDFWSNTFSGALGGQGQATRDALLALWKRAATRAERLYCTGTGSDASPGNLVWEGSISIADIGAAMNG